MRVRVSDEGGEVIPIRVGAHALGWWRRAHKELDPETYATLVKRRQAEKKRHQAEKKRHPSEGPT